MLDAFAQSMSVEYEALLRNAGRSLRESSRQAPTLEWSGVVITSLAERVLAHIGTHSPTYLQMEYCGEQRLVGERVVEAFRQYAAKALGNMSASSAEWSRHVPEPASAPQVLILATALRLSDEDCLHGLLAQLNAYAYANGQE
jgi:hypothetical protein